MSESDPLVHVGYAKTASTWLQRHLFAESSGVFAPLLDGPAVQEAMGLTDPFGWDVERGRRLLDASTVPPDRIPVVSEELLAGRPHSPGYEALLMLDRLADLLPRGRYLIIIREQLSAIASRYDQYVFGFGDLSLTRYLRQSGVSELGGFNPRFFEYDRLIGAYQERFGPERVGVLPWELFREDPRAYVDAIARFAGVVAPDRAELGDRLPLDRRENPGRSWTETVLTRWGNRAVHATRPRLRRLGLPAPARDDVRRAVAAMTSRVPAPVAERLAAGRDRKLSSLAECFVESNRRTEELTGLQLGAWGYPV